MRTSLRKALAGAGATMVLGATLALAAPTAAQAANLSATTPTADARSAASSEARLAAESVGPYNSLSICNYWKNAVQSAGTPTSDCYYWIDDSTCLPHWEYCGGGTGWYFDEY